MLKKKKNKNKGEVDFGEQLLNFLIIIISIIVIIQIFNFKQNIYLL